jgi:hypothetical protein
MVENLPVISNKATFADVLPTLTFDVNVVLVISVKYVL